MQGAHEEAASGRQAIRPLHLSKVHLSAHDQTGTQTSDTEPLAIVFPSMRPLSTRLIIFLSIDRTETLGLEGRGDLFDHVTISAKIDGQVLNGRDSFLNQTADPSYDS